jgi:hypothetical protein
MGIIKKYQNLRQPLYCYCCCVLLRTAAAATAAESQFLALQTHQNFGQLMSCCCYCYC